MKRIRLLLSLALAATLVWVFWYAVYSSVLFYRLRVFKAVGGQAPPSLTRPILSPDGLWRLPAGVPARNRSSVGPTAAPAMPRILHQAFRSEMVYRNYLPMINSCLTVNPDWRYYLWRDSDAEAFIAASYPQFLPRYRGYRDNLERADSIRYIVLHHFGGIYLDMDVECRRPFFPALSQLPAFIDQERTEQSNIFWSMPYSAMNSAMGSVPGHPFFRRMIDAMLQFRHTGNAFDSTGPRLLTKMYSEYSGQAGGPPVAIMEPRVFSPLMDSEKDWRRMCAGHRDRYSVAAQGCRALAEKRWRLDDSDNATIAVHRFLHLGYSFKAASRLRTVNLSDAFPGRVNFYRAAVAANSPG